MKTFITTAALATFFAIMGGSPAAGTSTALRRGAARQEVVAASTVTEEEGREDNDVYVLRELQPGGTEVTTEVVAKEMTYQLAKMIPYVGTFAGIAVKVFWDVSDDTWWDDVKKYVQERITEAVLDLTIKDIKDGIDAIQNLVAQSQEYAWDGYGGDTKLDKLISAEEAAYHVFLDLRLAVNKIGTSSWDLQFDDDDTEEERTEKRDWWGMNYYTIQYATVFAPLHLSILKDIYMYGEYYHPEVNGVGFGDKETQFYKEELEYYAATYQEYFDWMRDNFWDYRLSYFDTGYREKKSNSGTCWGKFWREDELKEREDWEKDQEKTCKRDFIFMKGCPWEKIIPCLQRKRDKLNDEIMPTLNETFFNTISPMSTIEADAINLPPISCNPDQIHARPSLHDTWSCADRSECLNNEKTGDCELGDTCSVWNDCEPGLKCNLDTNRCEPMQNSYKNSRHLEAMPGFILSDSEWEDYMSVCSNVDYKLSLAVDSHMQFVAEPMENGAASSSCPSLLFHRGSTNEKEVLQLDTNPSDVQHWGVAAVGIYSLRELSEAHDSVELSTSYDVVLDNCGDYVANYASQLGVQATPEIAHWVATQLVEHTSGDLVANILSNANKEHYGIMDEMSEIEIVLRVVEVRAKNLYAEN